MEKQEGTKSGGKVVISKVNSLGQVNTTELLINESSKKTFYEALKMSCTNTMLIGALLFSLRYDSK